MESQLATVEGPDPRNRLSEREQKALRTWERGKDRYPLSLEVTLGMYELFLNGHSLEEIARMTKSQGKDFSLGMIADACVRHDWHSRRDAHLKSLFDGIYLKIKQTQTESVAFLTDMLAAAHRQHGDKLKEYLLTGDAKALSEKAIHIDSLGGYKKALDMLLQVTGQNQGHGSGSSVNINVTGNAEVKTVDNRLKASDAAELLRLVDHSENE